MCGVATCFNTDAIFNWKSLSEIYNPDMISQ